MPQRGLIYRGYDAMPWCPRCSVGLSQMEMAEGYQLVAHRAVFVRFPLRGRPDENLLVWTTTPWTLSSNVAAAVNPELTYLKVKHKDQIYYVAKGAFTAQRLEEQFKSKEWVDGVPKLRRWSSIQGEGRFRGSSARSRALKWSAGLTMGPSMNSGPSSTRSAIPRRLSRIVREQNWAPAKAATEVHRVVAWKDVGETEGTGIVHIAPGCGKEDFHLGKEEGLPPVAPLDDYGVFRARLRRAGRANRPSTIATTDWVLDDLAEEGPAAGRRDSIRTATRTAGAARRNCSSAWWTSGSST